MQQTQPIINFEEMRQDISEVKQRLLEILQHENPQAFLKYVSQLKLQMAQLNPNQEND